MSQFWTPLVFLLVATTAPPTKAQNSRTPLCNRCTCTNIRGADGVNVNCSEVIMSYDSLYSRSNWFSDTNDSYPVGKATFSSCDIGNLKTQFSTSNLTYLDLSDNLIQEIDDDYFARLQNMRVLILSRNRIERLRPEAFRGFRMDGADYPLKSLTTLKLDNNKLHTLHQDLFRHLEEVLEVLDLSYNSFKVIDQQTLIAIGSIIPLKELYLGYTDLRELPDHFTHTPAHLRVLDLSGNELTEVPKTLSDSHVLETLYFNDNPIVNLTEENGFPNISTLKVLHLCDMFELETIEIGALGKLQNLEELHICNNIKLSNIDPGALTRVEVETEIWPPIKKLYLEDNKLTNLDFHFLLHWENLQELDMRYNPWTCECENQWMANHLMPVYLKINETLAKDLRCQAPVEMAGKTFYEEYSQNKSMRCLDYYGNKPERDAAILVGVLVGLLIGIPIILFMVFAYQRHWFGLFDRSPAAFSRQFYSRTRSDEL